MAGIWPGRLWLLRMGIWRLGLRLELGFGLWMAVLGSWLESVVVRTLRVRSLLVCAVKL